MLSNDDDENGVVECSEKSELVVCYREALILLDKHAYVDGMSSENIGILFGICEKLRNRRSKVKQSSIKNFFK